MNRGKARGEHVGTPWTPTYAGLRSPHKVSAIYPAFIFKVAFGERQGSTSYRGRKFKS